MESKKELLKKVLKKLEGYWDIAEVLKAFVESENVEEKDINNILKFLQSKIKKIRKKVQKNKIVNMKKKIAEVEEREEKELEDIEKLLDKIDL